MSKKPENSAFKQQKLKAWQPILTPKPVIFSFIVIGVIFIPVGYVLLDASESVIEVSSVDYVSYCGNSSKCSLYFYGLDMPAPVYFYYKLENYYQNHRRYVKSRNDDQLRGVVVTSSSDLSDCDPYMSLGGSSAPADFYLPCGLIAKSLFNDTYVLKNINGTTIPVSTDGVAWSSDLEDKYNNPPKGSVGIRTIANFKDVDFIVWMRSAALPTFRKLWRIINQDLKGDYVVEVSNNYPVESFGGKKYVVLSTASWLGGKNPFLGYAYIVVGSICIFLGLIFAAKHLINGRRQGDTSYLEWANTK